jgi:peptide deformylase
MPRLSVGIDTPARNCAESKASGEGAKTGKVFAPLCDGGGERETEMALLRVLTYGDERLHSSSQPVEEMTADVRQLVADMAETMYAARGAGLAAIQVAVPKRLFVLDIDQVEENDHRKAPGRLRVLINPQIVWASDEDSPYAEGCLSVPGVEAEVYRPIRIRVRYRDEKWQEHEEEANELLGRVIQHELDHLDGILFVDRLGFVKRQAVAGQLRRLRSERDTIVIPAALAVK